MLVDSGYFGQEKLLTLLDAGKQMSPQRAKATLWNWHGQGQLNRSGHHIYLHVCLFSGGYHTSKEEICRYLKAVSSFTITAQCVGGSLHGVSVEIPDTDEPLAAEDFADQLEGRVLSASECYVPARFIDKYGKVRTFLIHQDVPNGQAVVVKMLEGE